MNLENQNDARIFGLDLVRAIAILMVVFSHLYYLLNSSNTILISLSGIFGYFGVELFFVLSGFLIGTILLKQFLETTFTIKTVFIFLKRRWFKTLPNYYLVLILNLLIASYFNFETTNYWKYFIFLQNFSNYSITFFVESWSLSVEEWTYILVPIFLFFTWKLRCINPKISFILSVVFLIIAILLIRLFNYLQNPIADINVWNASIKSVVVYRMDSILFGFIIAWLIYYFAQTIRKYRIYMLIFSAHLFLFQFLIMNVIGFEITKSQLYYNVYYFWLTSLTAALALPFFVFWKKSTYFNSAISFLSKTSYAVYLLHYSIISVLSNYLFSTVIQNPVLVITLYLGITFSLSYFLYRFFEKPIMNFRDR